MIIFIQTYLDKCEMSCSAMGAMCVCEGMSCFIMVASAQTIDVFIGTT